MDTRSLEQCTRRHVADSDRGRNRGVIVDDKLATAVVVNDEDQYSIWRAPRPNPSGGATSALAAEVVCLADIDEVLVDMRPLSLREAMSARAAVVGPIPRGD